MENIGKRKTNYLITVLIQILVQFDVLYGISLILFCFEKNYPDSALGRRSLIIIQVKMLSVCHGHR